MPELPQHDPNLLPNRRQAERMLEMIQPSLDAPGMPYPADPADDRPPRRSAHTFVVKADAPDALPCDVRLVGTFDEHVEALAKLNCETRSGVFVEVDAGTHITAEMTVARDLPSTALLCEASLSINCGRAAGPSRADHWQFVWMVEKALAPKHRDAIAEALASRGAAVTVKGPVLLRLAGFYSRFHIPQLVSTQGLQETQGQRSTRYTVAQLLEGFGLARATAAA